MTGRVLAVMAVVLVLFAVGPTSWAHTVRRQGQRRLVQQSFPHDVALALLPVPRAGSVRIDGYHHDSRSDHATLGLEVIGVDPGVGVQIRHVDGRLPEGLALSPEPVVPDDGLVSYTWSTRSWGSAFPPFRFRVVVRAVAADGQHSPWSEPVVVASDGVRGPAFTSLGAALVACDLGDPRACAAAAQRQLFGFDTPHAPWQALRQARAPAGCVTSRAA
jgi:hypothetical protein